MLEQDQTQRLLDIAFYGCQKGEVGLARQVIKGLDQLLSDSPELEICRAMSFYTLDQFEEALDILDRAGKAFPDNQMIAVHGALVGILGGEKDAARTVLAEVISADQDKDAVKLAQALLEEAC